MSEKHIERVEEQHRNVGFKVEVKSKRGEGTRDQDTVSAYGYYETIEEAEEESGRLTSIVQQRMQEARRPDENGNVSDDEPEFGSDTIKGP